jgi:outer membrane scaffolding protein for murein synthesis (MipA/OmpV family)
MTARSFAALRLAAAFVVAAGSAHAEEETMGGGPFGWVHGEWRLTVGATGMIAPNFEGGRKYLFGVSPIVSLGKAGPEARFISRNDGISLSLFDDGAIRAGAVGKIIFGRDAGDADDLHGLDRVRWGGEAGGFAEIYPADWLRVRGEVRQGIRSHDGIVADISADAFHDLTPDVRVSAGPRLSAASSGYFDAYYGVTAAEAAASGVSSYDPDSGLKSVGVGGAIDWKTTENFTTSVFGEYQRLLGPAADSSLVQERGSENQLTLGVSAKYRFNFDM